MYSAIESFIRSCDEKKFYDVSLYYLQLIGYSNPEVVDGKNDGGKDVVVKNKDINIQLSVQKDWKSKINKECKTLQSENKNYLLYITNKRISQKDIANFLTDTFKYKGEIEIKIVDSRAIASVLQQPNSFKHASQLLGLEVPEKIEASLTDIAMSTLFLFSSESNELHEEIIESYVKSLLFELKSTDNITLLDKTQSAINTQNTQKIKKVIARMCSSGKILSDGNNLLLNPLEEKFVYSSKNNFEAMINADSLLMAKNLSIDLDSAKKLIISAVHEFKKDESSQNNENINILLSSLGFKDKKEEILKEISSSNTIKFNEKINFIKEILSTNTFDIYRALGNRTQITIVLDSSVALPLLFSLEFGKLNSSKGYESSELISQSKKHNFKIKLPHCYINEMASHGKIAFDSVKVYYEIDENERGVFNYSGNAYLGHYGSAKVNIESSGGKLSLEDFLNHFGINHNSKTQDIENKITSLLDRHNIEYINTGNYTSDTFDKIQKIKQHDPKIIVEHDSSVIDFLRNSIKEGFIFITYDKDMMQEVKNIARIYADRPAKVIDMLSFANPETSEQEYSHVALAALLYGDDEKFSKLSNLVSDIKSTEHAHMLNKLIDKCREQNIKFNDLPDEEIPDFSSAPL